MENPAQKIIETIKRAKIKPESRFSLRWKNYLFWIGLGLLAILGALSFSLVILNFLDFHPVFFRYVGLRKMMHILIITAPYLWLALILGALVLSLAILRKTVYGYRYNLFLVSIIGILLMSFLGTALHLAKFNSRFGNRISRGVPPFSRGAIFPMEKRWKSPEEGFLAGRVAQIRADNLWIISLDDESWLVKNSAETKKMFAGEIKLDMWLVIIGEKIGEKEFMAELIDAAPEFPESHPKKEGRRPNFIR